ncbi:MAG: FadR family transcriptional regulator [Firmicutes bacterium]|nr:FadR family transcriptional regulator [Bacillota bacterium]
MLETIDRIPKPSKLAETIAGKIRSLIQAGRLEPGERLPSEKELCEAFGVGRSSVREALQALEHLGLIESRQGVGRFLSKESQALASSLNWNAALDNAPVFELMEAREFLEGLVASLAAQRASDDDIGGLESTLATMKASLGVDTDKFFRAELDFHSGISRACNNAVISELVNVVMLRVHGDAEKFMRTVPETSVVTVNLFSDLLNAIRDGDPVKAGDLMREHLQSVRLILARQNQAYGNGATDRTDRGGPDEIRPHGHEHRHPHGR